MIVCALSGSFLHSSLVLYRVNIYPTLPETNFTLPHLGGE